MAFTSYQDDFTSASTIIPLNTKFVWMTFESNAYSMQSFGWEFKSWIDDYMHTLRLVGRLKQPYGNPEIQAVCEPISMCDIEKANRPRWQRVHAVEHSIRVSMNISAPLIINMTCYDTPSKLVVENTKFGELNYIEGDIYHWKIFERDDTDKIIIPEPSVLDLLNKVKEKQLPVAKDIVLKNYKERARLYVPGD